MARRRRILIGSVSVGLVLAVALLVGLRPWEDSHAGLGDAGSDGSAYSPPASGEASAPWQPPAPSLGGFPSELNTGVPEGTALTAYDGPCTILEPGTRIDGKNVQCDMLTIRAADVAITKSALRAVDVSENGSLLLEDSFLDSGSWVGPTLGYHNITVRRADIRGGQHSTICDLNCLIEDSWLHEQSLPEGEERHNNAFLSNGGSNVILRHNTLACEPTVNEAGGGCSGNASIFGDFGPNRNYRIEGNLFVSNPTGVAWCLFAGYDPGKPYGNETSGIVVVNNIFERGPNGKCGAFGAATSFLESGAGNVWSGNIWDDGQSVTP